MIRYERRKIADLEIDEHNPRKISKAAKRALATSVKRFGLVQPVIVNERTGRVVGGHQRIHVLREQGETEVDVAIGAWSEDEERVLNVALNNPGGQGEFTDVRDYLKDSLRGLSLDDFTALRFDRVAFEPTDAKPKTYDEQMSEVEDVDVTDINAARFQISIVGDLASQAGTLKAIRAALVGIKVDIHVGLAETNARR